MSLMLQIRSRKIPIKYLLIVVGLLGLAATVVIGLYQYDQHVSTTIATQKQSTSEEIAKLDQEIATVKARKAAEKRDAAVQTAITVKSIDSAAAENVNAKTCADGNSHTDPSRIDVVVNKKHCMQPLTYAPSDLVTVSGATLSVKAADSFRQLFDAAVAAGQSFSVTSSYRSFNDQVSTYQYWVGVSGPAGADTYSARPGYSEHQTGLVVDIAAGGCALDCFGGTSQYQWMQQHAAEYGFIQRYYAGSEAVTGYKSEEWHYRYVGTAVALDMKQKGIKTLEAYWGITGGDY